MAGRSGVSELSGTGSDRSVVVGLWISGQLAVHLSTAAIQFFTNSWRSPEKLQKITCAIGCVITSEVSNVVEDSQQRLWLVADKKLYMYDRNR